MNDEIKKEFASLCWGLTKVDDKWDFFWRILEKEGDKYTIFKTKMSNLIILLNNNDTDILNKDIENEIWDMI